MSKFRFRGVTRHKDGGWVANIGKDGKHLYLGKFPSFDDARQARLNAEISMFGGIFDRREIAVFSEVAKVPLHGRRGVFYGWAVIDKEDLEIVSSVAWTIDPRGYVSGRPSGFKSSITLHRWIMVGTEKIGVTIDHRDRDKLNNRRSNLRLCTQSQNSKNTSIPINNTSGAKGVTKTPTGRWRARIWLNRKEIHIGVFDSVEQAKEAYDRAASELHGEFASPNANTARATVEVRAI